MTAALKASGLFFCYPQTAEPALRDVSLDVPEGAFVLLVGNTGSGKTTLLRLAKPEIAPVGSMSGALEVCGGQPSSAVGYVSQSPDNQIVCDSVWREMAFGLENLGLPEDEMHRRVAETCYFFGMESWFHAKTAELSGGRRQILALAATLAMRPRLLLLDEPTAMLDPIAEKAFLSLLFRVNRELGVTVIVATHHPGPMLDYATMALQLEGGSIRELPPGALQDDGGGLPLRGVRPPQGETSAVGVRDVWFRYGREEDWVLRGLNLSVLQGEFRALVGGNGCGKSTLLSLVAGVGKPQRGKVANALEGSQALLPQSPKALLSRETVAEELMEWSASVGYSYDDVQNAMDELGICKSLANLYPYDLSGGEQQLVALAKLLLARPRLLLLDEPTKGLDRRAQHALLTSLLRAQKEGTTILVATHDMELVRSAADSASMLFDGQTTLTESAESFFANSWLWH